MTLTTPRPSVVPDRPADPLVPLLARAGAGDLDALAALYDATSTSVFGLALNVLGDEELAVEVTRLTYAQVWRGAAAYSTAHGPVAAWIVATTHRLAVAHVRTHGTAVPVGPHAANTWLDDLAPDEQHIVRLAYFGGRTYTEVARSTGADEHATAGRLGSALRAIRDAARRGEQDVA